MLTVELGDKHTVFSHMSTVRSGMAKWLYDVNLFLCVASPCSRVELSHWLEAWGTRIFYMVTALSSECAFQKIQMVAARFFYDLITGVFQYHTCFVLLTVICTDKGRARMNSIYSMRSWFNIQKKDLMTSFLGTS